MKNKKLEKRALEWRKKAVRLRDMDDNGFGTCISCRNRFKVAFDSKMPNSDDWHAGHFYSSGHYRRLMFDWDNIHGQCKSCNYYKSGNLLEYRRYLKLKIGEKRLKRLENLSLGNKEVNWSEYELNQIIAESKEYIKERTKPFIL